MHCTRTKRAATAVLLGIGGLLVAGAAGAQDARSQLYYAQETLTSTGATTVEGDGKYYTLDIFGSEVNARLSFNLAAVAGLPLYARVEFGNLLVKSGTMVGSTSTVDDNSTDGVCDDGEVGGMSVSHAASRQDGKVAVYALGSAGATTGSWCLVLDVDSATTVQVQSGSLTAKATLYATLRDALFGLEGTDLGSTNTWTIGKVESVVKGKVTGMKATASVDRGFSAFKGDSPNKADLATVSVTAAHNKYPLIEADDQATPPIARQEAVDYRTAAAGAAVLTATSAGALVKSARVDFSGDFSLGTFKLSGGAGCPAKGALLANDDDTELSGSLGGVTATPCTFSMDVTANAAAEAKGEDYTPIKAQKIDADLAITLDTESAAYPPAAMTNVPAGEIDRDGTTVQLPYLTTAAGYAQSVVIVNRGAKDAAFWIENVTSDGTDPTGLALAAAPMTSMKNSSMSVAVGDLVDLGEGGTTGSATLSVNAAAGSVDVLSMVTNQATGSTDTLQHDPM